MNEQVVLVNERDKEMGFMPKMLAHMQGALHRAFSVFIFNSKGEMLLQRRAIDKYHSGGLWTNACCSHPRPAEKIFDAANRRLQEEMGMKCELEVRFSFVYKAYLGQGLTEHEFDHVLTGYTDEIPKPDAEEVAEWKYISMKELEADMEQHPEQYTQWFRICMKEHKEELLSKEKNENL